MPTVCIVRDCNSVHKKGCKQQFFNLPQNVELQAKWIQICGATNNRKPGRRVCSRHFEAGAYERNLKYELLGLPVPPSQTRLKHEALPTLHVPNPEGIYDGVMVHVFIIGRREVGIFSSQFIYNWYVIYFIAQYAPPKLR